MGLSTPAADAATNADEQALEVRRGDRFEFGKNWAAFLSVLDEERIEQACRSLREMLDAQSLAGRTFVDVGCGSGLFSLAAMRLGAGRVVSFDFDPHSVACARELKRRYFPDASSWTVENGSALDGDYLTQLGQYDIVYSWGVLHHTGQMWRALDNVAGLVKSGGTLFIAIYRDQGWLSAYWRTVKRIYNRSAAGRALVTAVYCSYFAFEGLLVDIARLKLPHRRYAEYKRSRGMSRVHDWIDWVGGLPFEVARAEQIFDFYRTKSFRLERLKLSDGHGCNEFVFVKT